MKLNNGCCDDKKCCGIRVESYYRIESGTEGWGEHDHWTGVFLVRDSISDVSATTPIMAGAGLSLLGLSGLRRKKRNH